MANKDFKTLNIFDDEDKNEKTGEDQKEDSSDPSETLGDEDNLLVFSKFKGDQDGPVEIFTEDTFAEANAEAVGAQPEQATEPQEEKPAEPKANEKKSQPKKKKKLSLPKLKLPVFAESEEDKEREREERMAQPIKKRLLKFIGSFVLVCACIAVIIGSVVAALLSIYIVNVTADDGDIINDYSLAQTTILYAKDSATNEYSETQRLYGEENRIWVSYGEMPQHLIDAAIAIEDQHFLEHHGVDWKRTIFAAINEVIGLRSNMQGGSTITQQLVKNITNDRAVDSVSGILRKMREIYRSLILESEHSKTEIMEAYLNTMRLSGQYAGVEAGANAYFNCATKDLTIAQAAAIMATTNNPSVYSPLSNPEKNKIRREYILQLMLEQGKLTQEQYDAAMVESQNLITTQSVDENGNYIIPREDLIGTSANQVFDWFTDMVITDVLEDLQKDAGYTAAQANNLLFNGGLRVYTTKDAKVQAVYDKIATESFWPTNTDSEGNRQQGAMITMDTTGAILGVMGKIGEKTQSRLYNIATDGVRQVGSSMKPIGVYAPALEMNAINYSSLIEDQPIALRINGVLTNYPANYWRTYGDPVTIAKAVEQSYNTIAVRVLRMISFDYSYAYVTNMLGVTSLDPVYDKTYSSLALGGMRYGISLEEMVAAYIPFSNGGMYYEPHSYTKVTTADGKTVLDKTTQLKSLRAFTPETSMIMNKLMQLVVQKGSGNAAKYGSMPLAGKTGTTSDDADFMFIGMNAYYVTGCWVGYEYTTGTKARYPVTTRTSFKYVMSKISDGLPYKDFPGASGVVSAKFCTLSGGLATAECPQTEVGYYKSGYMPETCQHGYFAPTEDGSGD